MFKKEKREREQLETNVLIKANDMHKTLTIRGAKMSFSVANEFQQQFVT